MRARCIIAALPLLLLFFCPPLLALGGDPGISPRRDLGASEEEIIQAVRGGRLSKDELIRRGRDVSYFTRLKLYLYAKELEPYFDGLEDSFRDLARADYNDQKAIDRLSRAVAEKMARCYQRLMNSGRRDPQTDWRRGLTGLLWLDRDWRRRVYEQGKDEIGNPYDLLSLADCLDARLRGLSDKKVDQCPARAAKAPPPPTTPLLSGPIVRP